MRILMLRAKTVGNLVLELPYIKVLAIPLFACLTVLIGECSAIPCVRTYELVDRNVDYKEIRQRIHYDQLLAYHNQQSIQRLDNRVAEDRKLLDEVTGKYIDLDYSDHKRIGVDWMPAMQRFRRMTEAYSLRGSKFYLDRQLYDDISRALSYFCNYKPLPYCDNWFQQGITRPQTLALCLINMQAAGNPLPDSTLNTTIQAICKDTAVDSPGRNNPMHRFNFGANKSEIALGWVYIGALLNDGNMIKVGARELYAPLRYTTGEGIQFDRSFDMHYGYLYNGAYGAVLLKSITQGAWYLRSTAFALAGDKLKFFSDFIIESIFGQIRGSIMDWNILGRSISRFNATKPNFELALKRLQVIDPDNKKYYHNALSRMSGKKEPSYKITPLHQHYWRTDFTVRRRREFYFSVHGNSTRNYAQEIGNQENLKGYFGAEGVVDLMVTGNEYVNIFPLWNWKRLPGATLPDTLVVPIDKAPGEGDRKGTSDFCGGVTDSIDGLSVYTIKNDLGLHARKSWFMYDNVIYCLGAGIRTEPNQNHNIWTTLNQCFYDSSTSVIVNRNGKSTELKGAMDTVFNVQTMPSYILHGGVAYYPLSENSANNTAPRSDLPLHLKVDFRRGSWQEITSRRYPPVSGLVFELGLDHGNSPKNSAYSYAMLPGVCNENRLQAEDVLHRPDKIVANSDSIQAMFLSSPGKQKSSHLIAFYKAGVKYNYKGIEIIADKPCLVMLTLINGERSTAGRYSYKLSVSDPTWKQRAVNIDLSVQNENLSERHRRINVKLPAKPYAGNTVSQMIDL